MAIRPARIDDLEQICSLLDQLGGYDNTIEFMGDKLRDVLEHPDHYLLVYQNQKAVEGLASLVIIPELGLIGNTALITYIVVSPDARGEGVGALLEQKCCDIASERKCLRIQLHCAAVRTRAHKFYEKQGYKESPKYFSKRLI